MWYLTTLRTEKVTSQMLMVLRMGFTPVHALLALLIIYKNKSNKDTL
jgi:hypothetical protein